MYRGNKVGRTFVSGIFLVGGMLWSASVLSNSTGVDQPVEDTRPVNMPGDGIQGAIEILSDPVNNVVALYSSQFGGTGGDILARSFSIDAEDSLGSTMLQTISSECSYRDAAASGRADGQLVLLWCAEDATGGQAIYGQFYSRQLAEQGSRLTIDAAGGEDVRVDMNSSGEFVALWSTMRDSAAARVMQRFDAQGNRVGNEQQIDPNRFADSDIAIAESGDFVITYGIGDFAFAADSILVQRFSATGQPIGDPIEVASGSGPSLVSPKAAIAGDGTILLVWEAEGVSDDLFGRLYSPDGESLGGAFTLVSDLSTSYEVAASAANGFAVASEGSDDAFVRRVSTDGTVAEPIIAYSGEDPDLVHISVDADGDYATLVTEDGPNDTPSVFFRRFVGAENVDIATRLTGSAEPPEPGDSVAYELIVDNNHASVAPVDTELGGAAILNRSIGAATGLRFGIEYTAGLSDLEIGDIVTPDDERGVACENTEPRVVVCALDGPLYPGESISARVTGTLSTQDAAGEVAAYATANQFDANELTENDNNTDSIALSGGDTGNGGSGSGGGDDDDGSSGGGCTVAATDTPFDPLFVLVLVGAAGVIARRRSIEARRNN